MPFLGIYSIFYRKSAKTFDEKEEIRLGRRMVCSLCQSAKNNLYAEYSSLEKYFLCEECDGVFLAPNLRLGLSKEKKRYELHQNKLDSPDYSSYLQSILDEVRPDLSSNKKYLDYGCGSERGLERFALKQELKVDSYDPIYEPEIIMVKNGYDGIFAIEVVEHFFEPKKEFLTMDSLICSGGSILLRTSLRPEKETDFKRWWYRRDPTHVFFYSKKTFSYLADILGWKIRKWNPPFFHFQKK
ncbi:MAG: class I SAM-dependent methyltransferase [Oligoflexia bacterium]|nr:class I SAM-dependent methyltransferase [Oligoflexia bacterium]